MWPPNLHCKVLFRTALQANSLPLSLRKCTLKVDEDGLFLLWQYISQKVGCVCLKTVIIVFCEVGCKWFHLFMAQMGHFGKR